MHEYALALEIRRIAEATLEVRGGGIVDDVRVRIGDHQPIDEARLRQAWAALARTSEEAEITLTLDHDHDRQDALDVVDVRYRPRPRRRIEPDRGS